MNKSNILIIIFLSIFLISINSINAYEINNLDFYYTMGDGTNTNTIYDSVTQQSISVNNFLILNSLSGRISTAEQLQDNSNIATKNPYNIDYWNTDFSLNVWIKYTGTNNDLYTQIFSLNKDTNGAYAFRIQSNSSYIDGIGTGIVTINSVTDTSYLINLNSSIPRNQWNMFTFTYVNGADTVKTYINGQYIGVVQFEDITTPTYAYYNIDFINNTALDEMSLFTEELNSSDITTLYNGGAGLSYIETLSSENGYNQNYANDGYYHNYCWFNILCENYNISNGVCDDSPRKVCTINCADIFASLYPTFTNMTPSFNGQCYNNSYILQYPNYEGFNGTMIRNFCKGNYLCLNYNVTSNDTCPTYYNTQPNKISCVQQTGSIVAECFDTFDIYNNLGTYPPNNDYEGYCAECKSDCLTENATSCTSDNTGIQKCMRYQSCLKQFTTKECTTNEYCSLGSCVLNTTSVNDETDPGNTGINIGTRYIVVLISLLLVLGGCIFFGYAINMIKGMTIVGIVLDAFIIIIATVFEWIPPLFLIILIILAIASIVLLSSFKGGNDA